jgi:hypothetical protein
MLTVAVGCWPPGAARALKQQHRRGLGPDRRPGSQIDGYEQQLPRLGDHPYVPLLMTAPGIAWVLGYTSRRPGRRRPVSIAQEAVRLYLIVGASTFLADLRPAAPRRSINRACAHAASCSTPPRGQPTGADLAGLARRKACMPLPASGSRWAATHVRNDWGTRPQTVKDPDCRFCRRRPLTWRFSRVSPFLNTAQFLPGMPGTDLARRKPGVQIPSPPPQNQQVRASPASSGRRSPQ